jgi:aspartate carbamoyltransferase catalytic subunit
MHPLPRGPELDPAVDADPRAMYWRQERNGMWMRAAVLLKIFRLESRIQDLDLEAFAAQDGDKPLVR